MESKKDDRIKRESMLYMEPTKTSYGDPNDFAQCGSCFMFMGEKRNRCYILGKELEVKAKETCGLYVNGKPEIERAGTEKKMVSAEEAGYQKDTPNCKRCYWYAFGMCGLFAKLNLEDPDHFDMKVPVSPNGCCDGWTPQDAKFENEGFFEFMNRKVDFKKLLGL